MPEPGTFAEALAALQRKLPRVAKDKPGQSGQGRYLYADLTDCSEAILPLMAALGLSFSARPTMTGDRFVLHYELLHVSGDSREGFYPLPTSGSPQQMGAAITYARRYSLAAVTGLAPGGDDDDAASAEAAHHAQLRGPALTDPEDKPGSSTLEQQRQLAIELGKKGITSREDKLVFCGHVTGRDVESSKDLSFAEAVAVLKAAGELEVVNA